MHFVSTGGWPSSPFMILRDLTPRLACAAAVGNAVVNVYINREKNFAFVEFRTGEVFSCFRVAALLMDGFAS